VKECFTQFCPVPPPRSGFLFTAKGRSHTSCYCWTPPFHYGIRLGPVQRGPVTKIQVSDFIMVYWARLVVRLRKDGLPHGSTLQCRLFGRPVRHYLMTFFSAFDEYSGTGSSAILHYEANFRRPSPNATCYVVVTALIRPRFLVGPRFPETSSVRAHLSAGWMECSRGHGSRRGSPPIPEDYPSLPFWISLLFSDSVSDSRFLNLPFFFYHEMQF